MIDPIEWVPKCIGVAQLKELMFIFVEHGWKQYAPNFPVTIDDFRIMHAKKKTMLTAIIPSRPDVYCMNLPQETSKKGKGPYKTPEISIALVLATKVWEKFTVWDAAGRPTDDDGNYVPPSTDLMHSHDIIRRRGKDVKVTCNLLGVFQC